MLIEDETFTCVDIETTGLSAIFDEIIEIGAVKFTPTNGSIKTFSTLVKPDSIISPQITKINGITNEMVKTAPQISEVLFDFVDFIGDDYLLAHNASFDASFLSFNFQKYDINIPDNLMFDTLVFSRKMFNQLGGHSLSKLKSHFDISVDTSHRAVPDCIATIEVFKECLKKWGYRNKTVDDLSNYIYNIKLSNMNFNTLKTYSEFIKEIKLSIDGNLRLEIEYYSGKGERTRRLIDPYGIFHRNGLTYVKGFCHLRSEDRSFRIDRIKSIKKIKI